MAELDLIVIGAGPGGYVAAIRAAQLGRSVAVVDENAAAGGTCLRVGCIPSKALLESSERYASARHDLAAHGVQVGDVALDLSRMLQRKDEVVAGLTRGVESLLKSNGIRRIVGRGRLDGPGKVLVTTAAGEERLSAPAVLLATGSVPAPLPGVELDGDRIGGSTEGLSFPEVPERLVVIGAGYIGLELGSVWSRLGSHVTVLEYLDRILPGMDSDIATEALGIFRKQGLEFRLGTRVTSARREGDGCVVEADGREPLPCDRVLLAVGRRPNSEGLGLESAGIQPDSRGRVPIDDHFATTAPGVYAIGDLVRGPMLAHKAEEEGIACVERLYAGYGHVNYDAIPGVVYTHPEIATVGRSEDDLRDQGIPYRRGDFPFRANGRALSGGDSAGRVKILAHAKTDRILGVHIIGPRAGELIGEAVAAIEFGASSEDLARVCHAHPTLTEAVREAALAVDARAIHFAPRNTPGRLDVS